MKASRYEQAGRHGSRDRPHDFVLNLGGNVPTATSCHRTILKERQQLEKQRNKRQQQNINLSALWVLLLIPTLDNVLLREKMDRLLKRWSTLFHFRRDPGCPSLFPNAPAHRPHARRLQLLAASCAGSRVSVWAVDFDTDSPPPGRQEPRQLPGENGVNPFGSRGATRSHAPPAAAAASMFAAAPSASSLSSETAAAATAMATGQDTAASQLSVAATGSDSVGRERGGPGKGPEDASGKVRGRRAGFRRERRRESKGGFTDTKTKACLF